MITVIQATLAQRKYQGNKIKQLIDISQWFYCEGTYGEEGTWAKRGKKPEKMENSWESTERLKHS